MSTTDEKIVCVDCQNEFVLTEGWIKLMEENPDVQKPKRCGKCRAAKKARNSKNQEKQF